MVTKPAAKHFDQGNQPKREAVGKMRPGMERDGSAKRPDFLALICNRDYMGALGILTAKEENNSAHLSDKLWSAYCYFHLNDIAKAAEIYESVMEEDEDREKIQLYLACCYLFLGRYKESIACAERSGDCSLKRRVLMHVYQELGKSDQVELQMRKLSDGVEDQLSIASVHFRRGNYQEAIDVYKKIFLEHTEFLALNVYLALCYYKSEYYDVALNELKAFYDRSSLSSTFVKHIVEHNLVMGLDLSDDDLSN
ncbi:unnamed protein product [Soboliphyme baturini]|uniref:Tetratricopeptide repeat protein 26 n=1 Tax=Soboliphyme baturini TaxID=241478 RepID=A0A183J5Q8_9BILA|nr:unnamed protein product [Soboliphyme baturini]